MPSVTIKCALMNPSEIKILLVDDEPDILELVGFHLRKEGYTVFTASGGKEGVEIARREQPALIILDVMMPDMDGRRAGGQDVQAETSLAAGDLVIDRDRYVVVNKGREIVLPRKEFELLSLLTSRPGRVFKRDEIMDTVWGNEVVVGGRTIDVHIRKLREKIGEDYFKTIKGVGYKFEA